MRRISLVLATLVGLAAVASAKKLAPDDDRQPPAVEPAAREAPAPAATPAAESPPADDEKPAAGEQPPAAAPAEPPASKRPANAPGPFPLPEDLPASARFVVIELHDEVSLGMAAFVERVAGQLRKDDIVVLDINTFGGRVDAAVTIRDALLHAGDKGAKVVAYINPRAISAGALISYAADVIVVAPASTMGAATPVQIGQSGEMQAVEEKVVSYMRQEMRATAEARGRNGDIAAAMVDPDVEVDGLDDKGKTLTLDGNSSLEWGVASFEAKNFDALAAGLGYGADAKPYTVKKVGWSWAENLAGWLTGSVLSGLLMSLGMLGIMIGLYTGGSPIALGLGGTCLALFFFGHHVVNLAGIEDILLFLAGVALVGVEVFVPGHIFPGVIGLICIVAALFLGLLDFDNVDFAVQWHAGYVSRALSTVFGSILATVVLGYAAFRLLPDTKLGRGLLLQTRIGARAADHAASEAATIVGEVGTTETALRPSGKVKVGARRYDAVAERGYIEPGTAVKVVRRDGFHIVVAAIKAPARASEEEQS